MAALLAERLGDLERVQRSPFQQLITAYPERQPVVKSGICPDPANLAIIFPSHLERHGVPLRARRV